MRIHQSAEDYLEMILRLIETKGYARAIDISYGLSVTKPSVSVAMHNLRENGYITVDGINHIHLTDKGMSIAARIIMFIYGLIIVAFLSIIFCAWWAVFRTTRYYNVPYPVMTPAVPVGVAE